MLLGSVERGGLEDALRGGVDKMGLEGVNRECKVECVYCQLGIFIRCVDRVC